MKNVLIFLIFICVIATTTEETTNEPITEESKVVTVKEPQIDEADIDLLARLMTAEQGYNADEKAYLYTGSVVINRVNSEYFPNTLKEVIYQAGQYECVSNGHINRDYDAVAWEIAEGLLVEGATIPSNVVFQAEFKQGGGVYDKIGRTYFCYY